MNLRKLSDPPQTPTNSQGWSAFSSPGFAVRSSNILGNVGEPIVYEEADDLESFDSYDFSSMDISAVPRSDAEVRKLIPCPRVTSHFTQDSLR